MNANNDLSFLQKSGKPWAPSGYVVFSTLSRKAVMDANPEMCFGEISKLVGQKVKTMLLSVATDGVLVTLFSQGQ